MDPRFDTKRDPRFRRAPRNVRKVRVDKRFAHMFKDENFVETPKVDARGHRVKRDTGRQRLEKFYNLAEAEEGQSEAQAEEAVDARRHRKTGKKGANKVAAKAAKVDVEAEQDADEEEAEAEDTVRRRGKKASATRKGATPKSKRKSGAKEQDEDVDEEDDDEDGEDGEVSEDDDGAQASEEDDEDDEEEDSDDDDEEDAANADDSVWNQLDAEVPQGDATKRLAVMGCDWDHVSAADLLVLFRSYLTGTATAGGAPLGSSVDRVSVHPSDFGLDEIKKESVAGPTSLMKALDHDATQEDEAAQTEAMRKYMLQRTRYYYAVVECSSVETAAWLYDQLDGLEAEGMCPVTMDLRFMPDGMEPPHAPTSVATEVPRRYKAPGQTRSTVGHSKVKCTWDDAPPQRKRDLMKKRFTPKEIAEMDLQAYLASSSGEEGDSGAEALRKLVGGGDSDFPGGDDSGDSSDEGGKGTEMGDMEATFSLKATKLEDELAERARQQGKQVKSLQSEGKSVWEKYLDRKKELRRERKQQAKAEKAGKKAGAAEPEAGALAPSSAADLELVLGEDDEDNRSFNVRGPQRLVKKGAGRQAKADAEGTFRIDVDDPRISRVFQSEDFGIDPTHPEFRKSEGMGKLLRKKRQRTPAAAAPAPGAEAAASPASASASASTAEPAKPFKASAPAKAGGGLQIFGATVLGAAASAVPAAPAKAGAEKGSSAPAAAVAEKRGGDEAGRESQKKKRKKAGKDSTS